MSILPSYYSRDTAVYQEVDSPVEYEINFTTGQLTGRKVNGIEAIKAWIWLCLKIERFRYVIYSWGYGVELEQYIGQHLTQDFLEMDCRNGIEEALLINPYITGIDEFEANIDKDVLRLSFLAQTRLGDVKINV